MTTIFDVRPRFHLAFPVDDLDAARQFYSGVLGCAEGRSARTWVDFDLFDHQIVAHLVSPMPPRNHNPVDGDNVPVPHFGLLMRPLDWRVLANRLQAADVDFIIEPQTRFAGEPGEQSTMFVLDPAGNALEFKAFIDESTIFAT